MATGERPTLQLRGLPCALEAVLPPEVRDVSTLSASLATELPAPTALAAGAVAGGTVVRLTLPGTTPPGAYEAEVDVDGERYPAVIEVEPDPHLLLTPSALRVTVQPGGHADVHATFSNDGNVPLDLGAEHYVPMFARGGIERAFGAALMAKKNVRGLDRAAALFDELADNHGGLATVTVVEGEGSIEPGEQRPVILRVAAPDGLRWGATYGGAWALHNLRVMVTVTVARDSREPRSQPTGRATPEPARKPAGRPAKATAAAKATKKSAAGKATRKSAAGKAAKKAAKATMKKTAKKTAKKTGRKSTDETSGR